MYKSALFVAHSFGKFACSASLFMYFFSFAEAACFAGDISSQGSTSSSFSPAFIEATPSYTLDTGVSCPTSAFKMTGFAGNGNNSLSLPTGSAGSTDFGNYGVTVGLSIPIGGSLGKFCKDYAASVLKNHQQITQDRQINNQAILLNNCIAFLRDGVNFESDVFKDDRFSALSSCKGIPSDVWKKSANDTAPVTSINKLAVPEPIQPQILLRVR